MFYSIINMLNELDVDKNRHVIVFISKLLNHYYFVNSLYMYCFPFL